MAAEDKTLTCKECEAEFTFTVGEQEFYTEKGFENDPTRCKDCRKVKKDARRAAMRERRARGGGRGPRAPRAEGEEPRPRGVCFAFQKGECERGDGCRFQHVLDPTAVATA